MELISRFSCCEGYIRTLCAMWMLWIGVDTAEGYACPITNGISVAACDKHELNHVPWDLPHSIHIFHLENNKLAKLIGTPFFKFIYMEELYLSNNSVTVLEASVFQGCSSLLWIDLSNNKLKQIPSKAFINTPKLRHLNLNKNAISYVDNGAFSHLTSLQNLYMTNNKLHAIAPQGFVGLTSLRGLELQNNMLRKLDPDIVQSFQPDFLDIRLHQNPWHCDCSLRWLKQWLVEMATNHSLHWEFDLARPVCHSPWLIETKAFSDIPDSFFVCPVHILSRGGTVELEMGSTSKLTCEVNADPQASVFWYKNGEVLKPESTNKYDVVNDGSVHLQSSLFIYNFQLSDIASYNCRAINPAGANNVTFVVTIIGVDPDYVQHETLPVIAKLKLNVVAIIAIVVGSVVFVLAVLVIVCVLIYRRRHPPPSHYGVQMKVGGTPEPRETPEGEKPDEFDEGLMKEYNKSDMVDPLYDSVKARNVQYRNSLNTSTYISFKSEPSDPEDLAMLYASIPKRRYNGSTPVHVPNNDSLSPLLTPYHIVPPRLPMNTDHMTDCGDFSTLPLHTPPTRPASRTPSYCSTPPQYRSLHHPQKSCSLGSLGLTPPKKPPRLHIYASRDQMGLGPGNRGSYVGTSPVYRGTSPVNPGSVILGTNPAYPCSISGPRNRSSLVGTSSLVQSADDYSTAV